VKLERTYTFSPTLFGLLPMLNVLVLVLVLVACVASQCCFEVDETSW